jgi:hypothetical protein
MQGRFTDLRCSDRVEEPIENVAEIAFENIDLRYRDRDVLRPIVEDG